MYVTQTVAIVRGVVKSKFEQMFIDIHLNSYSYQLILTQMERKE